MKKLCKRIFTLLFVLMALTAYAAPAFAAGTEEDVQASQAQNAEAAEAAVSSSKAIAAAVVVGLASLAGAISMGWAISKSVDGIARQPEAEGKIRTSMMLGLVFVETVVIYALIVAILIIFVL